MKLKEYVSTLLYILKENPDAGHLEIFYAIDDEGNDYKPVFSNGTFARMKHYKWGSSELLEADSEMFPGCNGFIIN